MTKLVKILMNPWGFTLYKDNDANYIIKVMFSEGEYKIDVARFFFFKQEEIDFSEEPENMKALSEKIRGSYSDFIQKEISKSQFDALL